ncbi:response regulator [candidate division GN15 bacterium]|nr:response regulator [candidate division GN15 bacterium]
MGRAHFYPSRSASMNCCNRSRVRLRRRRDKMARILVVDDSQIIRDLLGDFLSDLGHEVETAVDGDAGIRRLRETTWDLCICDMHMPKKNGLQILEELGDDRGDMQFIFTDSLPDELHEKLSSASEFACLRKPFDLEQLRSTLDQALVVGSPAEERATQIDQKPAGD